MARKKREEAVMDKPKLTGTLVKVANPQEGATQQEYEDICKALGLEPKPPAPAEPPT